MYSISGPRAQPSCKTIALVGGTCCSEFRKTASQKHYNYRHLRLSAPKDCFLSLPQKCSKRGFQITSRLGKVLKTSGFRLFCDYFSKRICAIPSTEVLQRDLQNNTPFWYSAQHHWFRAHLVTFFKRICLQRAGQVRQTLCLSMF